MLFLSLLLAQVTPPPCPSTWDATTCIICQDLYVNAGVAYEDCPCVDQGSAGNNTYVNTSGSCCFLESCVEFDCEDPCIDAGGIWTAGGDCSDCTINPKWACCITSPNNAQVVYCVETDNTTCTSLGGTFNIAVDCLANPCGVTTYLVTHGACCYVDDSGTYTEVCVEINSVDVGENSNPYCGGLGGTFTLNTDCPSNSIECNFLECDLTGACCLEGVCYQLSEIDCDTYSGSFHAGKDCEDVECENPNSFDSGACCVGTACVEVTYDTCTSYSNGQFMGAGTTCYGEMAVDCNNNDPIADGACCVGTACSMTDVLTCVSWSGQFLGHGTSCDNNPCDDAGGDLTGACCSADGMCTIKSEALCLESGSTFIGGQCGPMTCDNYSKECECILLQGILDNNRRILTELLDQGHTLEESLHVLNLIQQNTFNTSGLMEMQVTLMDQLVMDQLPTIIEILETMTNPDGTPSHLETPYTSANQESESFQNMTDSNNDMLYMFTKEDGGDMFGLSEITEDMRHDTAPVYTLEGSALSVSFLGQNTTLAENFEFDFSLLDDWGVRTIIRVVIVLLFSWWSVQMIWQETRRQ